MNAEIYAEWLRRQGQRVVPTASSYWHSEGMGIFQAFPYHWLIEPAEHELGELASDHGAVVLRYSMPAKIMPAQIMSAKMATEAGSYHTVCTALDYGFESLGAKTRHHTRRSLRECAVGPITFERYEEEGWQLRVDTLARQQRRLRESRNNWRTRCLAAADLEGFEVWAAEVNSRLAATLLIFRMDDWYYLLYQQCHRAYLGKHANNALTFHVTTTLLQRTGVRGIYYGMRSLDAPASVDEFKFHMGYQRRPVRERIVFHPAIVPLLNRFSHQLLKTARRISPRQRWLAKAEALVRLSLAEESGHTAPPRRACKHVPE
jgi:hypothetical protein